MSVHLVLRRLRDDVVDDAILPVEKEMGVTWKLPLSVFSCCGHVLLRVSALRGLGAVDVDVEAWDSRKVAGCEGRRCREPGATAGASGRPTPCWRRIGAFNLHVDGSRQAEVENLRDDVGGKKVERRAGKIARQLLAQFANIVCRRAMLCLSDTRMSASPAPTRPSVMCWCS